MAIKGVARDERVLPWVWSPLAWLSLLGADHLMPFKTVLWALTRENAPAISLAIVITAMYLASGGGDIASFALSHAQIEQHNYHVLATHMITHGSPVHLGANLLALLVISRSALWRLGPVSLRSALAYVGLGLIGGLSGALFWLAIAPAQSPPMLGASGAICAYLAIFVRQPLTDGPIIPLFSPSIITSIGRQIISHPLLALVFIVPPFVPILGSALAWQAHLGGFIGGLIFYRLALRATGVSGPVKEA